MTFHGRARKLLLDDLLALERESLKVRFISDFKLIYYEGNLRLRTWEFLTGENGSHYTREKIHRTSQKAAN